MIDISPAVEHLDAEPPVIIVLGGGTGSFTLLKDLKKLTPEITAIVNMCDDGGSSGVLRDELGVLPPGDVRQCLVALSDTEEVRELFNYRFDKGQFSGQSLGNIVLSGLELRFGSFDRAVKVASELLHITGTVVPATLDNHTLVMNDGDQTVRGEFNIGHRPINNKNARLMLEPEARVNPEARAAISRADLIVIAPGNLYGSLLPIVVVDGMVDALRSSEAKKIMVANLVTKPGQTDDWHVVDFVKAFEEYIGEGEIDFAIFNNELPSSWLLEKYASEGEFPVDFSQERFSEVRARAIGAPLVAKEVGIQDRADTAIKRTLIRHDALRVGEQIISIHQPRPTFIA